MSARARRVALARLISLALFLLAAIGIAYSLHYPSLSALRMDIKRWGFSAPLLYALIYALASLLFIPKNLLSVAAGAVFGFLPAMVIVMVGATVGAVVAFAGARRIGRVAVERLAGRRISGYDSRLGERPFLGILIARLIPLLPFTLLNYAAGLSSVRFLAYLAGTVVGMLPGTASYIALGAYGTHLHSWEFAVAAIVVVALSLAIRRTRRNRDV